MRRVVWLGVALALSLALIVSSGAPAYADEAQAPAPTAESRKEAARKFEEGTRAFDAGDFRRAGEAFETAYQLTPHEDPLWNAARAWHRAGETARAANLYARYLRTAPSTARDRANATTALSQLATKLARIEVHLSAGLEGARVDGSLVEAETIYVVPGTHVVRARSAQGDVESQQTVSAGEAVSVVLSPPAAPAPRERATLPPPPPAEERPHPESKGPRRGWSPIVVIVEGFVTVALGGLTLWSGLETMSTLHTFETTPSREGLESGRSQQTRTNVLLGTAIGAAAITGVTALWLTDWGTADRAVLRGGL
jgi:hypothetical protein